MAENSSAVYAIKRGWQSDPRRFTAEDARVEKLPESGCWIWMCHVHPKTGYGMTTRSGVSMTAHRAFYEGMRGRVPDNLVLDHIPTCRTRSCVNPDHLRAVTQRENLLAVGSVARAAVNAAKPDCPACGSAYRSDGKGGRFCRKCKSDKQVASDRAARAARRMHQ